jgi:hypothetical protein
MPAPKDLVPVAMTETERLAERRFEAYFAFETAPVSNPYWARFDRMMHEVHES